MPQLSLAVAIPIQSFGIGTAIIGESSELLGVVFKRPLLM
jgi:hypothetical protein